MSTVDEALEAAVEAVERGKGGQREIIRATFEIERWEKEHANNSISDEDRARIHQWRQSLEQIRHRRLEVHAGRSRDERSELFGDQTSRRRTWQTLGTATDAVESLHRTRQQLEQEVDRMGGVDQVLSDGTEALSGTASVHNQIAGSLRASSQLITKLNERDAMDRLVITAAAIVFLLVVAYIWIARLGYVTGGHFFTGLAWKLLVPFGYGSSSASSTEGEL